MAAVEEGLLAALMRDGCQLLEAFFKQHIPACAQQRRPGERHYQQRQLQVHSVLGTFSLWRDYFYDGQHGRAPLDEHLGLQDSFTPGLQRLMSRAGAMSGSFEQASADLQAYARLQVSGRSIQRMAAVVGPKVQAWLGQRAPAVPEPPPKVMYISYDGTGVPTTPSETVNRKGKQPDGSAKSREVKLGCVFTQLRTVQGEPPERDPDSTTYVASFDEAVDFGGLIRQEATIRGLAYAQNVVVLGDGAPWIWEVARVNFPTAVEILDLYHAFEHVNDLAALIYPNEPPKRGHAKTWRHWLKAGKIDQFIKTVAKLAAACGKRRKEVLHALAYFQKNRDRMRYATFRKSGYFVGSGVQNVLATRCAVLGNLFDAFCSDRTTP